MAMQQVRGTCIIHSVLFAACFLATYGTFGCEHWSTYLWIGVAYPLQKNEIVTWKRTDADSYMNDRSLSQG